MNEKRANQLIQKIGSEIVGDPAVAKHDWDGLAVVAWDDGDLSNFYGYRYRGNECRAIEFETGDLFDRFMKLRDAMAKGEPRKWVACLYTIKQPGMDIDVTYEYDDPDRWKISPDTIDTMPKSIRPR